MPKSRLIVVVEPVIAPPLTVFSRSIRLTFEKLGFDTEVKGPVSTVDTMTFASMDDILLHTVNTAANAATGPADFTSYVFPTIVEAVSADQQHVGDVHVVFFAVRNQHGREWVFSQFFGAGPVPPGVMAEVEQSMHRVLSSRGNTGTDISVYEFERASIVIKTLSDAVESALRMGVHAAPSTHM